MALGDHAHEIVVIGGLNPDFLAPAAPVEHLGTTDVDVLFELGFVYDRDDLDYSWLPPSLEAAGFEPRSLDAWQWVKVEGSSVVRIDLLCDVADSPSQSIALPGTAEASAKNLAGPSAALSDPVVRALGVPPQLAAKYPDSGEHVELRFASLGGYLLAKASALTARGLVKDAYDFMFVALYNESAAVGAALAIERALTDSPLHHDHRADLANVLHGFVSGDDFGLWFATSMRESGDDATVEDLMRDARLAAAIIQRRVAPLSS